MTTVTCRKPRRSGRGVQAGAAALAAGVIAWTSTTMAALPPDGFADLVEEVSPAVVYVSTTHAADAQSGGMEQPDGQHFDFKFPPGSMFEDLFKRFQQQKPQMRRPIQAMGSGFLLDASGSIVTNNHVIDGADKVQVKLQDGRAFDAAVVGTDPQTDLALLKIEADAPLPFVAFGDSDALRVGDVVVAVGSPFGLGGTVTAGIVSARNRDINAGPYDDYIQTDAPINRGNSGGPLFNTKGEVVGVNTAIFSPSGGSVGIGFAIPANMARDVIAQLKAHGDVERGWLGVKIQTVSPQIAEAMNLDGEAGALISEVTEDSPAAKAGLRQGDVIVSFDGTAVKNMRALPRLVAKTRSGDEVEIDIRRDGKDKTLSVIVGELKPELVASADGSPATPGDVASKTLGAELAMLDDSAKTKLKLPQDTTGVVVTKVDANGRAAAAGLRPGDVIEKVGTTEVGVPADVKAALSKAENDAVLLLVNRGGDAFFVGIKLADA